MNPDNRTSNLVAVFLILATIIALSGACSPSPAPSAPAPKSTPAPTGNQPPVISSLTADPSVIVTTGRSTITCIASDPDGDTIRYSWKIIDGNITGRDDKVTWFPPSKKGNFNITVLVSDGKGGEVQRDVSVTVATITKSVIINVVPDETGTVDSRGDKDKSRTLAGDDDKGVGYRAFWSFDIGSLNNTEVNNAKLIFTTKNISGNPFAITGSESLGGFRLWKLGYTERLPNFTITGTKLEKMAPVAYEPLDIVDVTPELAFAAKGGASRFQIGALFMNTSNGNEKAEWIEWSDIKLEVTYTQN